MFAAVGELAFARRRGVDLGGELGPGGVQLGARHREALQLRLPLPGQPVHDGQVPSGLGDLVVLERHGQVGPRSAHVHRSHERGGGVLELGDLGRQRVHAPGGLLLLGLQAFELHRGRVGVLDGDRDPGVELGQSVACLLELLGEPVGHGQPAGRRQQGEQEQGGDDEDAGA